MNSPSPEVRREIAGCVAAHRRLLDDIADLTDDQARQPSLLPDWSVGHVLTHLARNADGVIGMIDGAARGEVVAQYPSLEARAEGIATGADRPAAELVDDVRGTNAALEQRWRDADDTTWAGQGLTVAGPTPVAELPSRRWREVEVHHSDLGLGFTYDDWSEEFVRLELVRMQMLYASRRPMGMTALPQAALAVSPRRRLAWLLGRTSVDGLERPGIF